MDSIILVDLKFPSKMTDNIWQMKSIGCWANDGDNDDDDDTSSNPFEQQKEVKPIPPPLDSHQFHFANVPLFSAPSHSVTSHRLPYPNPIHMHIFAIVAYSSVGENSLSKMQNSFAIP